MKPSKFKRSALARERTRTAVGLSIRQQKETTMKMLPEEMNPKFVAWFAEVRAALDSINMPVDEWQTAYPFNYQEAYLAGTSSRDAAHQANTHYWAEQDKRTPRRFPVKVYEGIRSPDEPNSAGETIVTCNGQVLPLRLWKHSPTGFNWGYGGSGPAQLALAILYDYFNDKEKALRLYQRFKFKVVAAWPQEKGWSITGAEIDQICADLEALDKEVLKEVRKLNGTD